MPREHKAVPEYGKENKENKLDAKPPIGDLEHLTLVKYLYLFGRRDERSLILLTNIGGLTIRHPF